MEDNRRLILKQLLLGNLSADKLSTELGGVTSEYLPIMEKYPQYRHLIADAVRKKEGHILEQFKEAYEADFPEIKLIGCFFDLMKDTFTTETEEEQEERFSREYSLIIDKQLYVKYKTWMNKA